MLRRAQDFRRLQLDRARSCRQFLARFKRDTGGGAMIYAGLALPVLLGVSGLAVDGSFWLLTKRSL